MYKTKKRKAIIDDGMNPELVQGAAFDGCLGIPFVKKPEKLIIPTGITPFIYRNRAIGYYLQSNGAYVIPQIRWGNALTYTTEVLPEKVAFLGAEKHSIIAIGTYGCVHSHNDKCYFKRGLEAMLETLEPEIVLVYGSMPDYIFKDYLNAANFVQYPDWITRQKRGDR